MSRDLILVVGATGQLGGAIARRLVAAGHRVRVMSRAPARLASLAALGAEPVEGDLLDPGSLERACAGAAQVVSTANNVRGQGASSPNRVDLQGYRHLCAVLPRTGVSRIVHISARGLAADSPVDFFRVKFAVDQAIRTSGVPWVLVQPSAFMDVWVSQILGDGMRTSGVATLFGDGLRVSNFVAVDDVANITVRVVGDATVRNEAVQVGGPSNLSFEQVAQVIERALGIRAKRRHIPVALLRWGPALVRPFNEVAARLMSLGYFAATTDATFPDWEATARRFGESPITVEQFVDHHFRAVPLAGHPPAHG